MLFTIRLVLLFRSESYNLMDARLGNLKIKN